MELDDERMRPSKGEAQAFRLVLGDLDHVGVEVEPPELVDVGGPRIWRSTGLVQGGNSGAASRSLSGPSRGRRRTGRELFPNPQSWSFVVHDTTGFDVVVGDDVPAAPEDVHLVAASDQCATDVSDVRGEGAHRRVGDEQDLHAAVRT